MSLWTDKIMERARMMHEQIAAMNSKFAELGIQDRSAIDSFYAVLDNLYLEDLPLARAKDNSDLLLHVEGPSISDQPKITLVSSIFDNVKFRVRDLTKAIAGIKEQTRVTVDDVDLALSGLAKGSLFVGFAVPLPTQSSAQTNLLAADDPIYQATKNALNVINVVSHTVDDFEEDFRPEALSEAVDDPKVRDAALIAVKRIAPSGYKGIEKIGVSGGTDSNEPATLTPRIRSLIHNHLRHPKQSNERFKVRGIVREIDLDARRFELRSLESDEIDDLRCIYSNVELSNPRALLDSRVEVEGTLERRNDHKARLAILEAVSILQ